VLTPGPIRAGTRIREDRVLFGRNGTQELEVTTIERPHRLRLLVHHPDLHYELDHLIDVDIISNSVHDHDYLPFELDADAIVAKC